MYIYIYPPAPFRGPSGCEAFCCNLLFPGPSNHLNHRLTIKFSIHFQFSNLRLAVCQSAISL